jgi:hypothetical protein
MYKMQETENTEGTVKFKRMEFDTRGWSTEKIEKLCKKLEKEGIYGERSIKDYLVYPLIKVVSMVYYEGADKEHLTTYEEYMGEEVKSSMREVVLTSNTVSIDSVIIQSCTV